VALVTDEGEWNQHEPNSGMARMFVVMLLIHVVLIGGIIVYDFMGDEETPQQTVTQAARAMSTTTGLPQASEEVVSAQAQATADTQAVRQTTRCARATRSKASPWPSFGTTEQEITKLNLIDKGMQIGAGTHAARAETGRAERRCPSIRPRWPRSLRVTRRPRPSPSR
jgi:hypothetical protein